MWLSEILLFIYFLTVILPSVNLGVMFIFALLMIKYKTKIFYYTGNIYVCKLCMYYF